MPSNKNPNSVVLPGDGAFEENQNNQTQTVSASEIAIYPIDGLTWNYSGDVAGALVHAYAGLNTRDTWVLDATGTFGADFSGTNAIDQALAVAAGQRVNLFLRPGTYTVSDTTPFTNCVITATPNTNSDVTLENFTGDTILGAHTEISNVTIRNSGNLNIGLFASNVGYCKLSNVYIRVDGIVNINSTNNLLERCDGSFVDAYVQIPGASNVIRQSSLTQVLVSGVKNSLESVNVGFHVSGGINYLTPAAPGVAELRVTGDDNTFKDVEIRQSAGSPITGQALELIGSRNKFYGLSVSVNTSRDVIGLDVNATHNSLNNVNVFTTVSNANIFFVPTGANFNEITNVRVATVTLAATYNVFNISSNNNKVNGLDITGVVGSPASLITVSGDSNSIGRISALTSKPASGGAFIRINGKGNQLSGYSHGAVAFTAGTSAWIDVQGTNHQINDIVGTGFTAVACPLLAVSNCSGVRVDGVVVDNLSATAGAGFQLLKVTASQVTTISNTRFLDSGSIATTSGLITMGGCRAVTLDGFNINNVGFGSAINSSMLSGSGFNRQCEIKNLELTFVYATNLINIDQSRWDGLLLEGVNAESAAVPPLYVHGSGTVFGSGAPIKISQCTVSTNSNSPALFVDNFGSSVVVDRCSLKSDVSGGSVVYVLNSANVKISNCAFTADSSQTEVCLSQNSGTTFDTCTFIGFAGLNNALGTPVFNGWGLAGHAAFPNAPLTIKNCLMLLDVSNIAPSTTTRPLVFIGGSGTTGAANHGSAVVDGLTIKPSVELGVNPSYMYAWHKSPTLCIDNENLALGLTSSYSNIKVDVSNYPITSDGTSTGVLVPSTAFNALGALVEIDGPEYIESLTETVGARRARVKNLNLARLPRSGGGGRSVLLAAGVDFEDLSLDAVAGTGVAWGGPAVLITNCSITRAEFWNTTSIPVGATSAFNGHLVMLGGCHCDDIKMRSFATSSPTAPEQGCLVFVGGSCTLVNSDLNMPNGSHIPALTGTTTNYTASGGVIVVAGGKVVNNKIVINHNAKAPSGAPDVRVVIWTAAENSFVSGNSILNLAFPAAAGYSSTPASSNGGGALIYVQDSPSAIVVNNVINYTWESGSDVISSIEVRDSVNARIIGNITKNLATSAHATPGGTNRIRVIGSGSFLNIMGNYIEANSTSNTAVILQLNTSSGQNTVSGNHIWNPGTGTGSMTSGSGDLPSPAASFNYVSP